MSRPNGRMSTSAIRNSWTLTQNARTMSGHESAKTCPLKNDSWTSGQPGALTTIRPSTVKNTIVLTAAIRFARRVLGRAMNERRPGAPRRPDQVAGVARAAEQTGHLDGRAVGQTPSAHGLSTGALANGSHLSVERLERPVVGQRLDRLR